jgi:DNA repair protein RadA/Sms
MPEASPVRVSSGTAALDAALGGGLVLPSTALVAGPPGAGKTTLLASVAASVGRSRRRPALYLSAEMPAAMVAAAARRAGADPEALWVLDTDDMAAGVAEARSLKACAIVVDSLPRFVVEGERPGSEACQAGVVREAIALARELGAVVLCVGHSTVDDRPAGGRGVTHDVDAVAWLWRVEGGRKLRVEKHRFGPAPVLVELPG